MVKPLLIQFPIARPTKYRSKLSHRFSDCRDLLWRLVDLHVHSTAQTNERAVAGVTSGLIGLDQRVTWEATHFFIRQRLTVEITQFDQPNHFRDSMVKGIFKHFDHDHYFEETNSGTQMRDVFAYSSPYGVLGNIANVLLVHRHLGILLETRNQIIKQVAESGEADRFLEMDSV